MDKIRESFSHLNGNADCLDSEGKSGMVLGVIGKHRKVITYLIETGADIILADKQKKTPLHYAADNEDYAMCLQLLMNNADPNYHDSQENAPGVGNGNGKIRMFIDDVSMINSRSQRRKSVSVSYSPLKSRS